jgi:hypothetical protein
MYPKNHFRNVGPDVVPPPQNKEVQERSWFGNFFKNIWKEIQSFASDVEDIVEAVGIVIQVLETGNYSYSNEFDQTDISYNYNGNGGASVR